MPAPGLDFSCFQTSAEYMYYTWYEKKKCIKLSQYCVKHLSACMRACLLACARARACVRAQVCVCVCVRVFVCVVYFH